MKASDILKKMLSFAILLAVIATQSTVLNEGAHAEIIYNVVPRMTWSLSVGQSAMHTFTFGNDIYEFKFDPIDISAMTHLEFDIYIPDVEVVKKWKIGETEFEITSSGTCDIEEYAWSGYTLWKQAVGNGLSLRRGWNHVRLNLPKTSAADLSKINYIRWYWNQDGEGRTMPGCRVANLKFTVRDGVDPANAHLEPFIPTTLFDTEDVPVVLADITQAPYNADPTGTEDVTKAIQNALYDVSLNGGGTVWMPAGRYRVTGPITIPGYVMLRGDWADPEASAEFGTVIALDIPEEDRNDKGTFTLGGAGGVYGLTVYYPNQSIDDVKAYPFTFYVDGHTSDSCFMPSVVNCTVLNGYRGIGATTQDVANPYEEGHENMYVLNFRGTFLSCGAESYNQSDFGFWDDVKISGKYWKAATRAGILPPTDERVLNQYTKTHATGLVLGDLDWESLNNITVDSCLIGIHTVQGKRKDTNFQGMLYGITTKNCAKGMVVDALHDDIGMLLANSTIDGGLYNATTTVVKMFNVKVQGAKEGRFREDSDYSLDLPIPDTDYGYIKPKPILYTANLDISGRRDVSSKLQTLLNMAGTTGGVVYLPGGLYRLDAPISVPAGVELKGTSAVPTKDFPYDFGYGGTTLLAYYTGSGANDRALITLNGHAAGLNGLRINYPENHFKRHKDGRSMFETAYAVRGSASNVYIVNSYITSSAYGVDFSGCDHHCVMNLAACCYENILKVGGKNGLVCNCVSNPYMFYVTATPYVQLPNGDEHMFYGNIAQNHCRVLTVENATSEMIVNVAMCCSYITLTNNDSEDVTAINLAMDESPNGYQTVMNGGSLTVLNAMRYGGTSFRHKQGLLRLYNRFEHGFSSGLHGDAIEETYVVQK